MTTSAPTFHHGGRIGDLFYALYTMKKLVEKEDRDPGILYLSDYHDGSWSTDTINALKPVLLRQNYIARVEAVGKDWLVSNKFYEEPMNPDCLVPIEFDLHAPERVCNPKDFPYWDRSYGWPGNVNIAHRTAKYFGVEYDPEEVWLDLGSWKTREGENASPPDIIIHNPSYRETRNIIDVLKILRNAKKTCLVVTGPQEKLVLPLPCLAITTNLWIDTFRWLSGAKIFFGSASSVFVASVAAGKRGLVDLQKHCHNNLPLRSSFRESTHMSTQEVAETLIRMCEEENNG